LRIAGSNGNQIFEPEAMISVHRYSSGIPRVINLVCEHCLVSAFVDQQKVIGPSVVDNVARDFDLGDNTSAGAMKVPPPVSTVDKFDVVEAIRSIATLAERIRQEEKELREERKI
jgi:hypothetical protein